MTYKQGYNMIYGCGQKRFGSDPILVGIGEFTTHFRTYFSGWIESDVHWGLTDLDLDPWPYGCESRIV